MLNYGIRRVGFTSHAVKAKPEEPKATSIDLVVRRLSPAADSF